MGHNNWDVLRGTSWTDLKPGNRRVGEGTSIYLIDPRGPITGRPKGATTMGCINEYASETQLYGVQLLCATKGCLMVFELSSIIIMLMFPCYILHRGRLRRPASMQGGQSSVAYPYSGTSSGVGDGVATRHTRLVSHRSVVVVAATKLLPLLPSISSIRSLLWA